MILEFFRNNIKGSEAEKVIKTKVEALADAEAQIKKVTDKLSEVETKLRELTFTDSLEEGETAMFTREDVEKDDHQKKEFYELSVRRDQLQAELVNLKKVLKMISDPNSPRPEGRELQIDGVIPEGGSDVV